MSREHPIMAAFREMGLGPRDMPLEALWDVPAGARRYALVDGEWIEVTQERSSREQNASQLCRTGGRVASAMEARG